jgi:putative endonuclease
MTSNVMERLAKHNSGFGPEYTKRRRPLELIWCQEFKDSQAARKKEIELKGWNRKKKLSLIVGLEKSEGQT